MNQRGALIIGSAIAGLGVCSLVTELVRWALTPGRIEEISWLRIQTLIVWPAAFALAVSSAFWSRRPGWQRSDAIGLAAHICVYGYLLYYLFITLMLVAQDVFSDADPYSSTAESIAFIMAGGVFLMFVGVVTTAVPTLLAEYAVIRFVRRRWSHAVSTGVVP